VPGTPWAPSLADVARHIPTRTRAYTGTPGSDRVLGTFTEATTPTAEQAQADIDAAVRAIVASVGQIPTSGDPAMVAAIQGAARDAAEWRAAADIELAWPNRDADVSVARELDARATGALATLKVVLAEAGSGLVEDNPQWAFPEPVAWGDVDL
jgi:hypothetical protein